MMIELPEKLETALNRRANAQGVSATGYVRQVLERDLASPADPGPLLTGADLVAELQASPFKELCLEPTSECSPVRDATF